jgi:hypothetical protein
VGKGSGENKVANKKKGLKLIRLRIGKEKKPT